MPAQWHDARGPASSMGTGQEARGAGKEPDFVAMAFDDRRLARGEDVVAAADRCDAGFAEELHRPQAGAVAAVHGVIVGDRHAVEAGSAHPPDACGRARCKPLATADIAVDAGLYRTSGGWEESVSGRV